MKRVWLMMALVTGVLTLTGASVMTTLAQQDEVAQQRQKRSSIRAFHTAPPVIPHEAYANDPAECAFCHSEVRDTPQGRTVITPHIEFRSCAQCHVRAESVLGQPVVGSANTFEGLQPRFDGDRLSEVSPPTVPHRNALRENCLTCHAANSPYIHLRCPHPERSQCSQCHVAGSPEFGPAGSINSIGITEP